jgi:hypothetical protein
MLTKKINGEKVACSTEEEAEIIAEWEANSAPPTQAEIDAQKDARAPLLNEPQKAFAALMEILWDNSAELRTVFPDPDGKAKFKQAGVAAYRAKL